MSKNSRCECKTAKGSQCRRHGVAELEGKWCCHVHAHGLEMEAKRQANKQVATKGKPGRPRAYKQHIADEICERIAKGETLISICKDDHMPCQWTVWRWDDENENGFSQAYAHARKKQADHFYDENLEIADNGSNDWMERANSRGEIQPPVLDHEHVQRSRLRIDTRKWAAAVANPEKYSEKKGLIHSGSIGGDKDQPTLNLDLLTPEEQATLHALVAKAQGQGSKRPPKQVGVGINPVIEASKTSKTVAVEEQ